MPEVNFKIQWPDGKQETCYSPSLIVKKYFEPGETYTISEFLEKSRESLTIASDRVQAAYGFPCSRALGQLKKIEATAEQYKNAAKGEVSVLEFQDI
ncbi:MAG: MSMEG_0570 family nitrogen starvation response protein [Phormidesmis sp.]